MDYELIEAKQKFMEEVVKNTKEITITEGVLALSKSKCQKSIFKDIKFRDWENSNKERSPTFIEKKIILEECLLNNLIMIIPL